MPCALRVIYSYNQSSKNQSRGWCRSLLQGRQQPFHLIFSASYFLKSGPPVKRKEDYLSPMKVTFTLSCQGQYLSTKSELFWHKRGQGAMGLITHALSLKVHTALYRKCPQYIFLILMWIFISSEFGWVCGITMWDIFKIRGYLELDMR